MRCRAQVRHVSRKRARGERAPESRASAFVACDGTLGLRDVRRSVLEMARRAAALQGCARQKAARAPCGMRRQVQFGDASGRRRRSRLRRGFGRGGGRARARETWPGSATTSRRPSSSPASARRDDRRAARGDGATARQRLRPGGDLRRARVGRRHALRRPRRERAVAGIGLRRRRRRHDPHERARRHERGVVERREGRTAPLRRVPRPRPGRGDDRRLGPLQRRRGRPRRSRRPPSSSPCPSATRPRSWSASPWRRSAARSTSRARCRSASSRRPAARSTRSRRAIASRTRSRSMRPSTAATRAGRCSTPAAA